MYKRKRTDLIAVLDSTLSPLFLGQIKNLHKLSLSSFKQEMLEGLRGEGYNFAEIVNVARQKWEAAFLDGAKEALIEDTDWTYEDEFGLLKDELKSVADQCRKDETKKMVNAIEVCGPYLVPLYQVTDMEITMHSETSSDRSPSPWSCISTDLR